MRLSHSFLYIGLFFLVIFSSCKKDLDEVSDPGSYSTLNYPATTSQLQAVLGGVYTNLRDPGLWGFELLAKDMYSIDHTSDLGYLGDAHWNALNQNSLFASNNYAKDLWQSLYIGVQRANTFLAASQNYRTKYASAGQEEELSLMEGEALFLKSLYNFYLINFFGESSIQDGTGLDSPGVPIIDTTAASLAVSYKAKSTVRQVWDVIIRDLKLADQKLNKHTWNDANKGRVPGWAPLALLGKSYVFTGDYINAKTVLKQIIDNSGAALVPFDTYRNMFNGKNEFNQESLYEINVQYDNTVGFGIFTGPNITTSQGLVYSPTLMSLTDTTAVNNGFGNSFLHDKNLQRFGFNLPIWNMIANPAYDASKPAGPKNLKNIIDPNYVTQSLDVRNNRIADPRLYISALQPWVDSAGTNGTPNSIVLRAKEIPANLQSQYYGWSLRKYGPIDVNIFNVRASDNANFYILRLADIYLLYAEACQATGEDAIALEYTNKVHRRAYGFTSDAASSIDYVSLVSATKATDPVLGNNPLRYERWAELFAEGQWWFDVRRWKIGEAEAAFYQKTIPGPINWSAKAYYFPIPQGELDSNPNMTPSTGY